MSSFYGFYFVSFPVILQRKENSTPEYGKRAQTAPGIRLYMFLYTTVTIQIKKLQKCVDNKKKVRYNITRRLRAAGNMRIWRNWQTRMVQVHMKAISCRFKSCYPHQVKSYILRNQNVAFSYIFKRKDALYAILLA